MHLVDDLRWIMATAFVVWIGLGLGFGLRQGVRAGFVLFAILAAAASTVGGGLGLLALIAVTPFCAIAALAGVWLGARLRPWMLRQFDVWRQSR